MFLYLGLERANLLTAKPLYKVVLCNSNKEMLFGEGEVSRKKLEKIVNLQSIAHLAVWSNQEFKLIENLTDRKIILIKDWYIKTQRIKVKDQGNINEFSLLFTCRFRKGIFSGSIPPEFQFPPLEIIYTNDEPDLNLSCLAYKTKIIALCAKKLNLENSLRNDKTVDQKQA